MDLYGHVYPRDPDSHSDIGCNGETGRDSGTGFGATQGDEHSYFSTGGWLRRPVSATSRAVTVGEVATQGINLTVATYSRGTDNHERVTTVSGTSGCLPALDYCKPPPA